MTAIGSRLGRYDLAARLGEGGMGVVYKAHDTLLNRTVALKILPSESLADPLRRQRFTQEAQAASALNHPNIVTIYDIGQADGIDFIAMEFVQGRTLADLIGRHGLPLKDTLSVASQAAGALAKAHASGIIHRDLKPSNLMVTDDGVTKILDFGVAKLLVSKDVDDERRANADTMAAGDAFETIAGTIVGTAAYMSPEQAEGKKVDSRSDIFSFGAVMYEMATGTRAFQRGTTTLTLAAVVNEEPTPPHELARDLPHELERTILRCLRKDPARRFQGMADLAVELDEIRTESGTHASAVKTPGRRGHGWWAAGAIALLALAGAAAWALWPTRSAPPPELELSPITTFHGWESWPSLSPDGRQVVFARGGQGAEHVDLYVLSIGTANAAQLTTHPAEDIAPAWSPDGTQIAFLRVQGTGSSLYLTPPTPNSERKIADVRPVSTSLTIPTIGWLADGRGIVLAEYNADRSMNGVVVIPIDGGEQRRLVWTPTTAGTYHYPSLSMAGDVLAYALCAGTLNCDLYTLNLAGGHTPMGTPKRLTEYYTSIAGLAWLPDGRSILFSGGSHFTSALWRVFLDGRPRQRLSIAGERVQLPVVSRNGAATAYVSSGDYTDIWKLGPNGGTPFLSSTADDMDPQFSPDGTRIAFESTRLGKLSQLWVANADGTNPVPLNDGSDEVQGSVFWSPDGRWLVFDGRQRGESGIYIVDAAGGRPRQVTPAGTIPSWSRDGKWIYFNLKGQVWKTAPGGGETIQVTDHGGGGAIESPDGKTLYYTKAPSTPGAQRSLFARPVSGGPERRVLDSLIANLPGPRQWVPFNHGVFYVAIAPDSKTLQLEVRFFDFASGRTETISRLGAVSGFGLTVSPDRKTVLYTAISPTAGSDIMLIRHLR